MTISNSDHCPGSLIEVALNDMFYYRSGHMKCYHWCTKKQYTSQYNYQGHQSGMQADKAKQSKQILKWVLRCYSQSFEKLVINNDLPS